MKIRQMLAEVLNAVVSHERDKVKAQKPDLYLNQKKQLWYGLMNRVDDGESADEDSTDS